MTSLSTLTVFTAASFALAITPGPDMLLIASRSAVQGRKAGFAALTGALLGCFCQAMAAGLGLSRLFVMVPLAFEVMRIAGAIYLLYLAWRTLRAPGAAPAAPAVRPDSFWRVMRQGLLTNLLNPKVALFMLALLPQFMRPEEGGLFGQVLVLSAIQMATGFLVNVVVALFAAEAARWLAVHAGGKGLAARLPNYLLAGVFAGLALRLAWPERP